MPADDGDRSFGMVEVDDHFQFARRWRIRRFVDDRDLFLLGTAFERVTQAEQAGGDDRPGRGTTEAVDRPVARDGSVLVAGDLLVGGTFGLVAMAVVHFPTVCRTLEGNDAA